jgi:DNA-directed RNA polymerase sigma subunit (sigma70/sigma32)
MYTELQQKYMKGTYPANLLRAIFEIEPSEDELDLAFGDEAVSLSDEVRIELNAKLNTLNCTESRVIHLLFRFKPTLEEASAELNKPIDDIIELEARAITKLRHPSRTKDLEQFKYLLKL